MKKIVLALALTAGSILAAYAQDADPFQKANETLTQGKLRNGNSWMKGKVEIAEQDGKRVIKVTPDDRKVTGLIYSNEKISVKAGDKVQVRIKASGKGKIHPSLWCYPAQVEGQKEKFLVPASAKPQALTEESQEMKFEIVIPQKKEEITYVRAAICFCGGTEVVLEQVEFTFAE